MSTGNVKISELESLKSLSIDSDIRIPISQNNGTSDAPQWLSYGLGMDILEPFIKDVSNSDENFNSNNWLELLMRLGYNMNKSEIDLSEHLAQMNSYYMQNGEMTESESFNTSTEITLKKGKIYVLNLTSHINPFDNLTIPENISWVTKVSKTNYSFKVTEAGEIITVNRTKATYEPIPTSYKTKLDIPIYKQITNKSTFATDYTGCLVFFAPEDMNVIFSLPSPYFIAPGSQILMHEIDFGIFSEIANQFLGVQGELMKVLVEAIVKNHKDIQTLQSNINSLGDVKANTIELDDYPVIQGSPMVVIKDRAPSAAGNNHGDDIPNKIGQIWVDTVNKQAYIAVELGTVNGWKPIKNA